MSVENLDFSGLLANMEAKRAALDTAIASLRAAISAGALGATGAFEVNPNQGSGLGANTLHNGEVPSGAFLGKSIPDAAKLYLSIVKKKQTTREIADALKEGGIESTSNNFHGIVHAVLDRTRKLTGEIVKMGDAWGLAEWYPAAMRNFQSRTSPPKKGAHKRKAKRVTAKKPAVKDAAVIGMVEVPMEGGGPEPDSLPVRIENLLNVNPDKTFTPSVMASTLGVRPAAINVRLARMVERERIRKVGPGLYTSPKGIDSGAHQMPLAV